MIDDILCGDEGVIWSGRMGADAGNISRGAGSQGGIVVGWLEFSFRCLVINFDWGVDMMAVIRPK